ncbi:MAG: NAD-dependent epimerase/dehydratase family protein, partial [Nitrospiria bacterium]
MKVLITGGTGFTGSHLARALVHSVQEVRVLARRPIRTTALNGLKVDLIQGEIQDQAAVDRAVEGCDIVYHLAANYRTAGVKDRLYHEVHIEGTRNVIEACRRYKVQRLVHCSTVGVHGHIKYPPATEEAPYNPGDLYQFTKMEAEKLVLKAIKQEVLPAVVFRPGAIYGPGDVRFLKLFRAIAKRRFVMLGSGETYYHMTYIDDLVAGILLCGTRPEALGQVFILAGPEYTTLNRLVAIIAETLGVPVPRWSFPVGPLYAAGYLCELICKPLGIEPPLYRRRIEFFKNSRAFDISKARKTLSYEPKVDLATGIQWTA